MMQVASSKLNPESMWGGSASKEHSEGSQEGKGDQEDSGSSSSNADGGCSGCSSKPYGDCSDGSESDDSSNNSSSGTDAWEECGVIPAAACLKVLSAATEVLGTVLLRNPGIREQQQQHAQLPGLLLHQVYPKLQQQQQMREQLPVLLLCMAVAGLRVFEWEALRLVEAAVLVVTRLHGSGGALTEAVHPSDK